MAKNFWRIFLGLSLMSMVGIGLGTLGVYYYFASFAREAQVVKNIVIEVPYGSSIRRVSELLFEKGLIGDAQKYFWYLRLFRTDSARMQAGYYEFDGEISPGLIAERLQSGRDQANKVTFKEGESLVDLASTLENQGLVSEESFVSAMNSPSIASLIKIPPGSERSELKNHTGGIEGYLFPDTYYFTKKDSGTTIIKKMYQRLQDKLEGSFQERMAELGKSLHEVLTLAAIVEKETGAPEERPLIASVYQNRLKRGMRLQADPTVIYGIKDYQGKIRKIDLLTYHPYNTYTIAGLPPGPIAAPGLESIRAVLWPATSNYLYFVSKNDGTHVFCENLACHNKAVQTWQIEYFKHSAKR